MLLPLAASLLLWNESFQYAYFDDISLTKEPSTGLPSFSLGTAINKPHLLEAHGPTGALLWQVSDNRSGAAFVVATARHTEALPAGHVNLVAISHYWSNAPSPDFPSCTVQGYAIASSTPVWSFSTPRGQPCSLTSLDFSDDGSAVALSASLDAGAGMAAALWLLEGQSGAVRWKVGGGNDTAAPSGPVTLSATGAYLCHSYQSAQGYSVDVLEGATGALRGRVAEGWNTPGAISDSGEYLVVGGQDMATFYRWNPASSTYAAAFPAFRPGEGTDWAVNSIALSSDAGGGGEAAQLVSLAWSRFDQKQARVTTSSLVSGRLLTDVSTPVNTQYGNSATVQMDGPYTGVALQGDAGDSPTVWLLKAGQPQPLFAYTSRGSMNSVGMVLDAAAAAVYLGVSGKACNNNSPCMVRDLEYGTQGAGVPVKLETYTPLPLQFPTVHTKTPTPYRPLSTGERCICLEDIDLEYLAPKTTCNLTKKGMDKGILYLPRY